MRRGLVLALTVPTLLLLVGQQTASGDHMLHGRYHWVRPSGTELRLQVYLHDVYWRSSFVDAMNEWARNSVFTFRTVSGSSCALSRAYGHVKVCDANYGDTGWGAVAEVLVDTSTNRIQGGRVRLNTYYRWTYGQARSAWCQEFGHVLGLDHRGTTGTTYDDPDSCMSYHPGEPEHPDAHDIAQLACQTVRSGDAEPRADCTSSSAGSSCTSVICISSQSEPHGAMKQSDGTVLIRFAMAAPRSLFRLVNRLLW